jgi:uncharacterized protein (TIGR02466 family)
MALRPLFVTNLYEASLAGDRGFDSFRDELASLDDLPRRATVFGTLKTKLDRHAAAFAEAVELDLGAGRLRLDSMWVNLLKPGAAHSGHIHPHSVLSGTVYVATPPGSGGLKLEDPRLGLMMAAPPRRAEASEAAKSFVYLQPEAGTVLMWESWLRHEVTPHRGRGERISVSFNYAWR